jgi:hypothetical protein
MIEILQRHGVAHRLQRPSHGFSRSLTAPDMPTVDRRKFLPEVSPTSSAALIEWIVQIKQRFCSLGEGSGSFLRSV